MKALYDHKIEFIEPTKLLEREICDTMTVTNYLGHSYSGGSGGDFQAEKVLIDRVGGRV